VSGRNVLRDLRPDEIRLVEMRATADRLEMRQAEALVELIWRQIMDNDYVAVEGPKVIRERVIEDGQTSHIVTAVAIVKVRPKGAP
jgi:hypothetical protein